MSKNKNKLLEHTLVTLFGTAVLLTGFFLYKKGVTDKLEVLPYLFIGIGCGIFGHGLGKVIVTLSLKNSPDIEKNIKIEEEDERNIAIRNRAKGRAYDFMIPIFGSLLLIYSLMKADFTIIILLVCAYLMVCGIMCFYLNKYQKEM